MDRRNLLKRLFGFAAGAAVTAAAVAVPTKREPMTVLKDATLDDFFLDSSNPMCRECGLYQSIRMYRGEHGMDAILTEIHFSDCSHYPNNLKERPWRLFVEQPR